MPSFSTPLRKSKNGFLRPIIPVLVADASTINPQSGNGKPQPINLQGNISNGLVDTGADMTHVSPNLAKKLNLTPLGKRPMASASHSSVQTNIYNIAVVIIVQGQVLVGKEEETKETQNIMLPMSDPAIIQAIEFGGDDEIDVLIGMDIIQRTVLVIAGHDKRLTMSF